MQEKHSKRCGNPSSVDETTPTTHEKASGTARWSRSARACDRCRFSKLKCDNLHPCSNCREKQIACTVTPTRRSRGRQIHMQTADNVSPPQVGGSPPTWHVLATTDASQTTRLTQSERTRMNDFATIVPSSPAQTLTLENLPLGLSVLPSVHLFQNRQLPPGITHDAPGHDFQATNQFGDIPPTNYPVWSTFDGDTDLMALFPDMPSLVRWRRVDF